VDSIGWGLNPHPIAPSAFCLLPSAFLQGLGYNTAAALQTIWAVNPNCYVEVIGLELNASVPIAAIALSAYSTIGVTNIRKF
jgi:hypothetical protein